jgi:hypothetical protein
MQCNAFNNVVFFNHKNVYCNINLDIYDVFP